MCKSFTHIKYQNCDTNHGTKREIVSREQNKHTSDFGGSKFSCCVGPVLLRTFYYSWWPRDIEDLYTPRRK